MNENDRVVFELDLHRPAALTPEQGAELEALAAAPDSEIDYGDIPPLTDAFFAKARPNSFYRPTKAQVTVRLDADVLAWRKTGGRGYQTKLNAILRRAMLRDAGTK